jgi:hypothetical protein
MPGVILQKISPDSITISMAASASQQPYDSPDEVGMRGSREAREARKAARAKNRQQNASANQFNGNGHSHSPSRDDYRYQDGDEPYSPTEDSVLQDSMLSQSQQVSSSFPMHDQFQFARHPIPQLHCVALRCRPTHSENLPRVRAPPIAMRKPPFRKGSDCPALPTLSPFDQYCRHHSQF